MEERSPRQSLEHRVSGIRASTHVSVQVGVHVDDAVIGGSCPWFEQSLKQLRETFPFRKWKIGEGTFVVLLFHKLEMEPLQLDSKNLLTS